MARRPAAALEGALPLFTQALADGTELPGYRIKRVLGAGGFAITYLAEHAAIGHEVAIKEYLPRGIAVRGPEGNVVPLSPDAVEDLAWGLERFREEARTLGRLKHPNIVPVLNYVEANGTAYAVMEFIAGETLEARIERGGALPVDELCRLLPALLAGVEAVHQAGFLHRDIKPSNIMLRAPEHGDGVTPVLIDFGAARQALSTHSRALTAILSEGYAPYEQYQRDSDQGCWTDIYALGATLYRCVTGEKPAAATSRVNARVRGTADPLVPAGTLVAERYPARLLAAIDRAASLVEGERPQSVTELRGMIEGTGAVIVSAAPSAAEAPTGDAATLVAGKNGGPHSPRPGETLLVGAAGALPPPGKSGWNDPPDDDAPTRRAPFAEGQAFAARLAQVARNVWLRRVAVVAGALVLAGGAAFGVRAFEEYRAAAAMAAEETRRAADAEEKRRAERQAAERAEAEAQAAAARELEAGRAANQARSYDEALTRLAAAIATGKLSLAQHTEALLARSAAWIGKGDFARAFTEAGEAVRLNPESAAAHLERGRIRWHRQEWEESLADFNAAIRLAPDAPDGYSLRGIVWYHKGDVDRAIADYGEALRLNPAHAEALFNRGLAWHRKGDQAKAAEDFRAALRTNPTEQLALNARRMLATMGTQ